MYSSVETLREWKLCKSAETRKTFSDVALMDQYLSQSIYSIQDTWHIKYGPLEQTDIIFCLLLPQLCEAALSHGYLPVVFNRRSHNSSTLTTVTLQQFGDPADLREAVRYIRYQQPAGRLYAVSESTGSGLLLSYLGECGSSSYVTAAVCLSPVFRCQSWFENGLGGPLQWALVLYQKICLSRYGGMEKSSRGLVLKVLKGGWARE